MATADSDKPVAPSSEVVEDELTTGETRLVLSLC